jgi:membrane protease subunit (stomatin/prohibitin family)
MAVALEIVEWFDATGQEMVCRIPRDGSGTFKLGAQLIVRESQYAIFFRDGRALDTFGPGRYTLSTLNLPILTRVFSLPFGFQSPFKAEIIFVNAKAFINMKWGTKQPVAFRDSEFDMIRLRAFGVYSLRVADPTLFVNKIVGTQSLYTTDMIQDFLRDIIVARLNDLLGETMKTILDMPQYYDELAGGTKARVLEDFQKDGIELLDFVINSITPPEEVMKVIDERSGMGAVGDMNRYMQFKAARAIEKASEADGGGAAAAGTASAGMGLGLGAGFGIMLPGMIKQAMTPPGQPPAPGAQPPSLCPKCNGPVPLNANFCPSCGATLGAAPCPKCNTPNPSGAKFCSNCGSKLA